MPTLVSLFSGAGGLDLGLEAAGFSVRLCVENDQDCQSTLRANRSKWAIARPPNIFRLKADGILEQSKLGRQKLDLLAAGPPCQPFSKAGYWHSGDSQRLEDPRARTLHSCMRVIECLQPRALIIENVEGIGYAKKNEGLSLLKRRLELINRKHATRYVPVVFSVNAADFGVPQTRTRVFLVAARDGTKFKPPMATHGAGKKPYLTAWDAIADLSESNDPQLQTRGKWTDLLPSIPEGKNYQWLTEKGGGEAIFGYRTRYWSFLLKLARNMPSWTIQAQPGPSAGPFHWDNRQLSAGELARLQTFPDDYCFTGDRRAVQRQIGNAVPPLLAEVLGREICTQLLGRPASSSSLTYELKPRADSSKPIAATGIPEKYKHLIGRHPSHPGEGKGPGAVARIANQNQRREN